MQAYYTDNLITLYHGRCEDVWTKLPACSFDAIICDEPYGTTACAWDEVIPFDFMWREIKRTVKPRAATVLFGSQPFTSLLIASNLPWFKYQWVWDKKISGNPLLVEYQPLKVHEDICVFGSGPHTYQPQMRHGKMRTKGGGYSKLFDVKLTKSINDEYYPVSVLEFSNAERGIHPTQKPLALMEYLVKTYTSPGDTVLDFTSGSGTTLRACKNLGRKCVGIEMLEEYCKATVDRLAPEFESALVDDGSDLSDLPLFAAA